MFTVGLSLSLFISLFFLSFMNVLIGFSSLLVVFLSFASMHTKLHSLFVILPYKLTLNCFLTPFPHTLHQLQPGRPTGFPPGLTLLKNRSGSEEWVAEEGGRDEEREQRASLLVLC